MVRAVISVADVKRSLLLYRDVLALPAGPRGPGMIALALPDGVQILLHQRPPTPGAAGCSGDARGRRCRRGDVGCHGRRVHRAARADRRALFDVARALGDDRDPSTQEEGIETLVVFLGANNALGSVVSLQVKWSQDPGYADSAAKRNDTVWAPAHFRAEFDLVTAEIEKINARNVILCTVPHVTIIPVARGVGAKSAPGSRYFYYYTRPWITDAEFSPAHDPHITAAEARAVDYAIDLYNEHIEATVKAGVEFTSPKGAGRAQPVSVDFDRLIGRDTLVNAPPQNVNSTLDIVGWLDQTVDVFSQLFINT